MNNLYIVHDVAQPLNYLSSTEEQSKNDDTLQNSIERCPWDDWHPITDVDSIMANKLLIA